MKFNAEHTASADNGLFGLPTTAEDSKLILLNCPWEVTTSYGSGASLGPNAILNASPQLDLFSTEFGSQYEKGIHLLEENKQVKTLNKKFKSLAQEVIKDLEISGELSSTSIDIQKEINNASSEVNETIYEQAKSYLNEGKFVGLVGGDHSSPFGLIKALSEKYKNYSILHIDAHHDLRVSYQGFTHSHASIMTNVLNLENSPSHLTQIGIRDFCESEYTTAKNDPRIFTIYDQKINSDLFNGKSWKEICEGVLLHLSDEVYISFDIDGLSPDFCPNTGTPVPGGLSYSQALYLISTLVNSGKKIIGFDLCEVAPGENEWDANVGARVLFNLASWMLESQSH